MNGTFRKKNEISYCHPKCRQYDLMKEPIKFKYCLLILYVYNELSYNRVTSFI